MNIDLSYKDGMAKQLEVGLSLVSLLHVCRVKDFKKLWNLITALSILMYKSKRTNRHFSKWVKQTITHICGSYINESRKHPEFQSFIKRLRKHLCILKKILKMGVTVTTNSYFLVLKRQHDLISL